MPIKQMRAAVRARRMGVDDFSLGARERSRRPCNLRNQTGALQKAVRSEGFSGGSRLLGNLVLKAMAERVGLCANLFPAQFSSTFARVGDAVVQVTVQWELSRQDARAEATQPALQLTAACHLRLASLPPASVVDPVALLAC